MASSSLRGGKNIYGPHVFQSNWFEQRHEPALQERTAEMAHMLPTATSKTWEKTSSDIGAHAKDNVTKACQPPPPDSQDWLKYQRDGPDKYNTSTGTTHCHPKDQVSPFGSSKPVSEEALQQYRDTWTRTTDQEQFKQYNTIGKSSLARLPTVCNGLA
mmetsp:Transcript_44962/g.88994  ORF Transcript_44962/g.88994 Transcript_44962/m.88994 type:complete len:158 (+) Transcript_44962:78-551(+)